MMMHTETPTSVAYDNYLKAHKVDREVTSKLACLNLSTHQPTSQPAHKSDRDITLKLHCQQVALKTLYRKLEILRHYSDASRKHLWSDNTNNQRESMVYAQPVAHAQHTPDSVSELAQNAERLHHNLQIAILQAQQAQYRSRHRLQDAKDAQNGPAPISVQRSKALAATKEELIAWIESRLAEASESDCIPATKWVPVHIPTASSESQIERRYRDYLRARRMVLDIAARPVESTANVIRTSGLEPCEVQVTHPLADSSIPIQSQTLQMVERGLLQLSKVQIDTYMVHEFVSKQVKVDQATTLEALQHLASESHLLVGDPDMVEILEKKGRSNGVAVPLGQDAKGQIQEQIQLWTSAAQDAQLQLTETVETSRTEGKAAGQRTGQILENLEVFADRTKALVGRVGRA